MRHINERGVELGKKYEAYPLRHIRVAGELFLWVMVLPVAAMADLSVWTWNLLVKLMQTLCLVRDLEAAEGWVHRLIKTLLTENQFSALTSFTFNVGAGALQRSTLT